ncbi:MAG: murein hydrolase activator EnvC family protein [Gammaproteobacteria bacterium]
MSSKLSFGIVGAVLLWLPVMGFEIARAQIDSAAELRQVQDEIRALEERLAGQEAELESEAAALRAAEIRSSESAASLREVRSELNTQRSRQEEIRQSALETDARLGRERAYLAEQVRMTYATGRQEALRLVLNQESPARLGRMVVYYDYLNSARAQRLESIQVDLATLQRLETEGEQVEAELARLESSQTEEFQALDAARGERQAVLATLERDIDDAGDELGRLQQEAETLRDLVAELGFSPELFPPDAADGFAGTLGELVWPVRGTTVNDYGDSRAGGQIRWNGVVIGAEAGTPVNAIYYGRVAYADWLTGLGLLIILDHGSGYMSLYGHNEVLTKEPGDWVVPGEIIARVGDTGGQQQTAVYFEIRENGEPLDPRRWMKSALE